MSISARVRVRAPGGGWSTKSTEMWGVGGFGRKCGAGKESIGMGKCPASAHSRGVGGNQVIWKRVACRKLIEICT